MVYTPQSLTWNLKMMISKFGISFFRGWFPGSMLNIRGVPGNRTALPWKSDGDLQQTHQRAETGIFQPVDNKKHQKHCQDIIV